MLFLGLFNFVFQVEVIFADSIVDGNLSLEKRVPEVESSLTFLYCICWIDVFEESLHFGSFLRFLAIPFI